MPRQHKGWLGRGQSGPASRRSCGLVRGRHLWDGLSGSIALPWALGCCAVLAETGISLLWFCGNTVVRGIRQFDFVNGGGRRLQWGGQRGAPRTTAQSSGLGNAPPSPWAGGGGTGLREGQGRTAFGWCAMAWAVQRGGHRPGRRWRAVAGGQGPRGTRWGSPQGGEGGGATATGRRRHGGASDEGALVLVRQSRRAYRGRGGGGVLRGHGVGLFAFGALRHFPLQAAAARSVQLRSEPTQTDFEPVAPAPTPTAVRGPPHATPDATVVPQHVPALTQATAVAGPPAPAPSAEVGMGPTARTGTGADAGTGPGTSAGADPSAGTCAAAGAGAPGGAGAGAPADASARPAARRETSRVRSGAPAAEAFTLWLAEPEGETKAGAEARENGTAEAEAEAEVEVGVGVGAARTEDGGADAVAAPEASAEGGAGAGARAESSDTRAGAEAALAGAGPGAPTGAGAAAPAGPGTGREAWAGPTAAPGAEAQSTDGLQPAMVDLTLTPAENGGPGVFGRGGCRVLCHSDVLEQRYTAGGTPPYRPRPPSSPSDV